MSVVGFMIHLPLQKVSLPPPNLLSFPLSHRRRLRKEAILPILCFHALHCAEDKNKVQRDELLAVRSKQSVALSEKPYRLVMAEDTQRKKRRSAARHDANVTMIGSIYAMSRHHDRASPYAGPTRPRGKTESSRAQSQQSKPLSLVSLNILAMSVLVKGDGILTQSQQMSA